MKMQRCRAAVIRTVYGDCAFSDTCVTRQSVNEARLVSETMQELVVVKTKKPECRSKAHRKPSHTHRHAHAHTHTHTHTHAHRSLPYLE